MRKIFSGAGMINFSKSCLLTLAIAVLAGCGAGGGGTSTTGISGVSTTTTTTTTQTITGTVATGAPLAGVTVYIEDSTGQIFTSSATAANGTFSVTVPTGMKTPFMLRVHNPTAQNPYDMYSLLPAMTVNTENVNITPITTLVMFELNNKVDPGVMYRTVSFSAVTLGSVETAETTVRNTLSTNSAVAAVPQAIDMMYSSFSPGVAGDLYDIALDSIGNITALSAASGVKTTTTANAPAGAGVITTYAAAASAGQSTATNTPSIILTPLSVSVTSTSAVPVTATVYNASNVPVSNAIVTFSTNDAKGGFSGGANTALTNSNGVATVSLTTTNTGGGAATLTSSSTVGGIAVTNSQNYAIGSSSISLSPLTLPATALSAYGTASITVQVLNNGVLDTTPMTVSFTSTCASLGKATLTASVTSVNGIATASYLDNGCNNARPGDTLTATLSNGFSVTGSLPVSSPALGSIQFVSVVTNPVTTPTMITLKGTGGANRSETAKVTFKVVDSAGNPFSAPVAFSLNTTLGGLALSSYSATSDPTTGQAVTNVQAGTFSTAVRVTANICSTLVAITNATPCAGTTLSTQSDQLLVSTGVPSQSAFSVSASTHNIEGWAYDGVTTTLTARLADHFSNPVPDGTAVYFTSEGGAVTPSCTTLGGVCTATLTSQALRPDSDTNGHGRVTVLVTAVGEESFTDLNSNGTVDSTAEMIDANGHSTDIGYAYVDYNENGVRDADEPYVDFNTSGSYTNSCNGSITGCGAMGVPFAGAAGTALAPLNFAGAPAQGDGFYHGVLCTAGLAICSTQKSIDVRGSQVIIFSTSAAASAASITAASVAAGSGYPLPINAPATPAGANVPVPAGIVLSSCTTVTPKAASVPSTVTVTVVDAHGNAMPAGTTIAFSTTNGSVPTPASFTVPDTIGCRSGFPGCPLTSASPTFGDIPVSLISDATWVASTSTCTNTQSPGIFTVTVTTPKGLITTYTMPITD